MNKLIKRKDTFYILGDMNINISVKIRSPASSKFVENLISNDVNRCDSNLSDHYCTLCNITGNFVSQKEKQIYL